MRARKYLLFWGRVRDREIERQVRECNRLFREGKKPTETETQNNYERKTQDLFCNFPEGDCIA